MRHARHLILVLLGLLGSCTAVQVPIQSVPGGESVADRTPDPHETDSSTDGATVSVPRRDTVYVERAVPSVADTPVFADAMYAPVDIDPTLAGRISSIIDGPQVGQMHWGILARDMHDGRVIFQRNAHRKFAPASTMKVLTAAAALSRLGPDFRYETALWAFGELDGQGILHGPLILDGQGDPTLSDRFYDSGRAALAELARRLRASGVRRVDGPLIIDVSRWDSTSVEGTWMVEDLGWSWGASGGAFAIDEGALDVIVLGGNQPGDPAGVEWPADIPARRFRNEVVTTALDTVDLHPTWRPESSQIVLGGRIRPALRRRESLAARDPVRIAADLLLRAIEQEGITVTDGVRILWDRGESLGRGCGSGEIDACTARRLAALQSPPLIEVAKAFLGPSQNWMAEQMVKNLAVELGREGSWEAGLQVVEETLTADFAVLTNDLDLRDGSGLSAYGLVTPRALVDVLFKMRIQPSGEEFMNAMPSPGQSGTTLSGRLRELGDRLHAKTGTITHVNALAGYLRRDNGRDMVFTILTGSSGMESRDVRRAVDELVRELARW